MDVDDLQGEQELVRSIFAVVEGTEIQVRLRQSPQLLWRAGSCFRSHKQEALRILATLPFAPALSFWRHSLFIQALNPQKDPNALVEENDEVRSLQLTAVEALAVMSLHCPDRLKSLEAVARYVLSCIDLSANILANCSSHQVLISHRLTMHPDGDHDLMMLISSCLGIFACGYALTEHEKQQQPVVTFKFDCERSIFIPQRVCSTCDTDNAQRQAPKNTADNATTYLDPSFLDMFGRIPLFADTPLFKLTLLGGLYRVFCHLDLSFVNIRSTTLGSFVLRNLSDSNPDVAAAAG